LVNFSLIVIYILIFTHSCVAYTLKFVFVLFLFLWLTCKLAGAFPHILLVISVGHVKTRAISVRTTLNIVVVDIFWYYQLVCCGVKKQRAYCPSCSTAMIFWCSLHVWPHYILIYNELAGSRWFLVD